MATHVTRHSELLSNIMRGVEGEAQAQTTLQRELRTLERDKETPATKSSKESMDSRQDLEARDGPILTLRVQSPTRGVDPRPAKLLMSPPSRAASAPSPSVDYGIQSRSQLTHLPSEGDALRGWLRLRGSPTRGACPRPMRMSSTSSVGDANGAWALATGACVHSWGSHERMVESGRAADVTRHQQHACTACW